jgi:hypothetical protein
MVEHMRRAARKREKKEKREKKGGKKKEKKGKKAKPGATAETNSPPDGGGEIIPLDESQATGEQVPACPDLPQSEPSDPGPELPLSPAVSSPPPMSPAVPPEPPPPFPAPGQESVVPVAIAEALGDLLDLEVTATDLEDPLDEAGQRAWDGTARRNTVVLEHCFRHFERDAYRHTSDHPVGDEAEACHDPFLLKKVRGFLTYFPCDYLADEDISIPIGSLEYLAPRETFS